MEQDKYYTPDITEFKQGFKFERKIATKGEARVGMAFFNDKGECTIKWFPEKEDEWIEEEVWWDRELDKEPKVIKYSDITISYYECKMDLMPNYSLETLLKDGRIRAKK